MHVHRDTLALGAAAIMGGDGKTPVTFTGTGCKHQQCWLKPVGYLCSCLPMALQNWVNLQNDPGIYANCANYAAMVLQIEENEENLIKLDQSQSRGGLARNSLTSASLCPTDPFAESGPWLEASTNAKRI